MIRGGAGQDIIEGGAGDDLLFANSNGGGREEDVLFGGADSDILVCGHRSRPLQRRLGRRRRELAGVAFAVVAEPRDRPRDQRRRRGHLHRRREPDRQPPHRHAARRNAGNNGLFGGDGRRPAVRRRRQRRALGRRGQRHARRRRGPINTLRGGSGVDTVDYVGQTRGVQVDLEEGQALAVDRFDRLAEIEVVRGSNFADEFVGDDFGNQLFGNGGADTIDGGEGNDILSGGAGADIFVFVAPSTRASSVRDRDSGFDRDHRLRAPRATGSTSRPQGGDDLRRPARRGEPVRRPTRICGSARTRSCSRTSRLTELRAGHVPVLNHTTSGGGRAPQFSPPGRAIGIGRRTQAMQEVTMNCALPRRAVAADADRLAALYARAYRTLLAPYYDADLLAEALPLLCRINPALLKSGRTL